MLKQVNKEEGFFRSFHSTLRNSISDEKFTEFSNLETDEERVIFIYELPQVQELKLQASAFGKNSEIAERLKQEGNKEFQKGNFQKALKIYTESLLKTPWSEGNTQQLAVIMANRSAALYHTEQYSMALREIQTVLTMDYPKELHFKVKERKARCFLATKQLDSAQDAFRETLTSLDFAKLPLEKKKKMEMDIQIMLSMLAREKTQNKKCKDSKNVEHPISVSGGRNAKYPSLSKTVAIKESQTMGRFAEAAEPIGVGDNVLTEDAHCSVLLAEKSGTHCFQCFRRLIAPIPCPQCSIISFCNENCRETALNSHHKIECSILQTLWDSGSSITCLMALRIITQKGLKLFLDLKAHLKQLKQSDKYCGSDYLTVYNLVSHREKRSVEDIFHRTNMAVFLLRCLKLTPFFDCGGTNITGDEAFIGSLLLHHLQLLQFNAHEISELQVYTDGKSQSVFLGGGLYPTLALFNHSCNPAVTRYFHGTSVVVCAIRPLCVGEMVAENYGPIFTQVSKNERQTVLCDQYWFTCSCTPCIEEWPTFDSMDPSVLRFKCDGNPDCNNIILVPMQTQNFMVQCPECRSFTNILKGLKALQDTDAMFSTAERLMKGKNIRQALKEFIEILNLLNETLAPPFRDYHLCQQAIRSCFLHLGNKHEVFQHLLK